MDLEVLQAMQRWPNVPHVYGWLALDARGRWRIHPQGGGPGSGEPEPIANEQICRFIARNYAADERGCWYFQNGPQRVYVHLHAAPFIFRRDATGAGLETHTGLRVNTVGQWLLDDEGRLYAHSDAGPGMVDDRDLPMVLQQLCTPDGEALLDALEAGLPDVVDHPGLGRAPLASVRAGDVPDALGYRQLPEP